MLLISRSWLVKRKVKDVERRKKRGCWWKSHKWGVPSRESPHSCIVKHELVQEKLKTWSNSMGLSTLASCVQLIVRCFSQNKLQAWVLTPLLLVLSFSKICLIISYILLYISYIIRFLNYITCQWVIKLNILGQYIAQK